MIDLYIRTATECDAAELLRVATATIPLILQDHADPAYEPFLKSLSPDLMSERLASSNHATYVARIGDDTVGYITIREDAHVYHLFVHPGVHRLGVGRRLWDYARKFSSSSRFTVNSSLFAQHAYLRYGFEAVAPANLASKPPFIPMVWEAETVSPGAGPDPTARHIF